jgi:hypothetical protein
MLHFSESMIHGPDAPVPVPAFVSREIAELATALSARVRTVAGEPTAVVYLSCKHPTDPVSTRRSRTDE